MYFAIPYHMQQRQEMKRSNLKAKINEELTCGICHDLLHLPKILTQCSHTFCQKCLQKLFTCNRTRGRRHGNHEALDQLECPKCRQVTVLPQGRVGGLPTNCTLQSMAEIISAEPDDQPESEPQPVCKEHEGTLDVTQAGEMKREMDKKKENIASNCEETKGEIEVFFKQVKKHLEDREEITHFCSRTECKYEAGCTRRT